MTPRDNSRHHRHPGRTRRYGIDWSHHRRLGPLAVSELAPAACPNGHDLGPDRVLVGNHPCGCQVASGGPGAHRTWRCRVCDACWVWPPCRDRPRWVPWPGNPPAAGSPPG